LRQINLKGILLSTKMGTEMQIVNTPVLESHPAPKQELGKTRSRSRGFIHQVFQGVCVIALAFASYFVISQFFLQSVKVVGLSMSPTLGDSQRYLLNRWVYHLRSPARSDVVVIEDPADHGFSVKRVIAVEGDTVYFKDGHVYVNGKELREPYLARGTRTFSTSSQKDALFKCGKDQFFVLGDNRLNSVDSRAYGPVPRNYILGQIIQ
jgi:signal peptidase I